MKVTKISALFIVVLLFISFTFISTVQGAPAAQGSSRIWYVKNTGTSRLCNSWTNACTLQNALEDAITGDEIWVAAGIHKPTNGSDRTKTFMLADGVDVYGGFPAAGGTWEQRNWQKNPTILSWDIGVSDDYSDNSHNVVSAYNLLETTVIDGFTIRAGNGTYGAGMIISQSSPILTNLIFSDNEVIYDGGGLFNTFFSYPTLTNVTFSGNTAERDGGGMYNEYSSPALTNVTFQNNFATDGGGMYSQDNSILWLTNVTFSANGAHNNGGGLHISNGSTPLLSNVTFFENRAVNYGGGMYSDYSEPHLNNVTFTRNEGYNSGGGMFNNYSNAVLTDISFEGNSAGSGGGIFNNFSNPELSKITFWGNSASSGGGVYNDESHSDFINVTFSENVSSFGGGMYNSFSSPLLINVTFYGNSATSFGGGIMSKYSNPTLINTIFWANTTNQLTNGAGSTTTISYSIIQGGYPGTGNSSADPKLQPLASNGGFTQTHALGAESSAIDTGDPTTCAVIDQRGYPRPVDGDGDGLAVCDMGAYEADFSGFRLFLPSILR
jgi:predicted outer membrane repeat protein